MLFVTYICILDFFGVFINSSVGSFGLEKCWNGTVSYYNKVSPVNDAACRLYCLCGDIIGYDAMT